MTMTKLPTDVAFDLLVVEQLHDIVSCQWSTPCQRVGHWMLRCPGCKEMDTICTPHRVEMDSWSGVTCRRCDTPLPAPLPWVAV